MTTACSRRLRLRVPVGSILTLLVLLASGLSPASGAQSGEPVGRISAGDLPAALADARPGDRIEVDGGVYHGSLVIDVPLTLIGVNWPVLDGDGQGTILQINAPDTTVSGFHLRNTGDSLDREESAIVVYEPRALVENNLIEEALFGVYLLEAGDSILRGNRISGKALDLPRRGDLIRVWDSDNVLIENNTVTDGRDVVLWYSEGLTLLNNTISGGRYGLHFMYCDDAHIVQNRLTSNSVGAYLMYSRRLRLNDNLVAFNRGPSGYGVGLKDVDDHIITGNRFLDNRVGAFIDGSPREVDSVGIISGNLFAYNDIGIEMLPSVRHNWVSDNSFVENEQQVAVAGGGLLRDNLWTVDGRGNYWADYAGYDADGDSLGEIPYRIDRLFDTLVGARPELRLFMYSPVSDAIDFASRAFPVVRPQPVLEDAAPLTELVLPDAAPLPATAARLDVLPALLLPLLALLLLLSIRIGRGRYRFVADKAAAAANGTTPL